MAYIRFNKLNLHIDVLVGILEEYKPTPNIEKIYKRVEKLRQDTDKFIKKNWGDKNNQQLKDLFKESPEDLAKWNKYGEEKYYPTLDKLTTSIDKINTSICPGYKGD